jgi:cell division protease FtsH
MLVGAGAARVRETFEMARKNAPSILFIDELDAVGRLRGLGVGAGYEERDQTLNQILTCMDSFESLDSIVVIAATNRSDVLDPALIRPGRFDRRIRIPPLARESRIATLRIHTREKPLAASVSLATLADKTPGFSGAQIESLVNEAALLAVRRARNTDDQHVEIRMEDFDRALTPLTEKSQMLNKLDQLLVESTTQLTKPTGKVAVRVSLDGESIEGLLDWADAHFLKISGDHGQTILAKARIKRIEALDGAEAADPTQFHPDP